MTSEVNDLLTLYKQSGLFPQNGIFPYKLRMQSSDPIMPKGELKNFAKTTPMLVGCQQSRTIWFLALLINALKFMSS